VRHDRRGGRPASQRSAGQERWLVSYADFITLLFAFFTVMYAVSVTEPRGTATVASSIQQALSMRPDTTEPAVEPAVPPPAQPGGDLADVRHKLTVELADALNAGRLEISEDARGIVLSLPVEATFPVGSADVHPDARQLIGRIASSVGPFGNALRIEGHTDDVPIRTPKYGSNWELSTARASAVVAYLIDVAQIAPGRLSAAGYGEFHPRVPNDSSANRTRNRRVDLVVLNAAARREEPPAAGPSR
jgi:chemotaxis protein MotB